MNLDATLSKQAGRRYGQTGLGGPFLGWLRSLGSPPVVTFTITVRNFHGNTSTQTTATLPQFYVIGPPQYTYDPGLVPNTDLVRHGNFQGLFIREIEPGSSADGHIWYRWIEDELIGVAPSPTTYSPGVI